MGNLAVGMVEIFRTECMEQPARLSGVFQAYSARSDIRRQLNDLKKTSWTAKPLLWSGMGASYCSCISGATRLSLAGRPSFPVEASEWLHFAVSSSERISGPVLVTSSGESAELVELCRLSSMSPHILVCNAEESTCWKEAQIHFPILAGDEKGNATKTYTNSTAICTIIAAELLEQNWQRDSKQVTEAFAQSLEEAFRRREELAEFCREMKDLEVVARGAAVAGALMGALCIREMTGWRASASSGGSFRHGPLLDVDSTHLALILALGRTAAMGRRIANDCVAKGGKVILVVDQDPIENSRRLLSIKVQPVPESWEALTSVLVPQALTQALMERLGTRYVRTTTTIQ